MTRTPQATLSTGSDVDRQAPPACIVGSGVRCGATALRKVLFGSDLDLSKRVVVAAHACNLQELCEYPGDSPVKFWLRLTLTLHVALCPKDGAKPGRPYTGQE